MKDIIKILHETASQPIEESIEQLTEVVSALKEPDSNKLWWIYTIASVIPVLLVVGFGKALKEVMSWLRYCGMFWATAFGMITSSIRDKIFK